MDYFEWNFIGGFIALTIIISLAISPKLVRLASIPLCTLVGYVSLEVVCASSAAQLGLSSPVRMSSVPRDALVRSAWLVIAKDVVAVDANCGSEIRRLLHQRWEASEPVRTLFTRLDLLWDGRG